MRSFVLIALTACGRLEAPQFLDAATDGQAIDAAGDASIDAAVPAVRIRQLEWRWQGCADGLPFALRVGVDVAPALPSVAIEGQPTGCDPFYTTSAVVACAPTLPPAGRVLAVHAVIPGGMPHDVMVPITDCVDGLYTFPPDDNGDAP